MTAISQKRGLIAQIFSLIDSVNIFNLRGRFIGVAYFGLALEAV